MLSLIFTLFALAGASQYVEKDVVPFYIDWEMTSAYINEKCQLTFKEEPIDIVKEKISESLGSEIVMMLDAFDQTDQIELFGKLDSIKIYNSSTCLVKISPKTDPNVGIFVSIQLANFRQKVLFKKKDQISLIIVLGLIIVMVLTMINIYITTKTVNLYRKNQ